MVEKVVLEIQFLLVSDLIEIDLCLFLGRTELVVFSLCDFFSLCLRRGHLRVRDENRIVIQIHLIDKLSDFLFQKCFILQRVHGLGLVAIASVKPHRIVLILRNLDLSGVYLSNDPLCGNQLLLI